MDPALFVCVCFVAPSITWTVNESFPRGGGLDGSSVVWPDLESVPMMVSPIIRQLAPQSDGDMLVLICTMASLLSSFFFRDLMLTDCLASLAPVISLRDPLMRLSRLFILVDLLPVGRALLRCLGQFRLVHLLWRQDSLFFGPVLPDRFAPSSLCLGLGPFFFLFVLWQSHCCRRPFLAARARPYFGNFAILEPALLSRFVPSLCLGLFDSSAFFADQFPLLEWIFCLVCCLVPARPVLSSAGGVVIVLALPPLA
jgi:hypothetical protein